jgi:hypothetical protein
MNLVERAKAILQKPHAEWKVIGAEEGSVGSDFLHYAAVLALIPPVAVYVGLAFTGYVGFRIEPVGGLVRAVIFYGLLLASVIVLALVVNGLAGIFGGTRNFTNALKVAIYAPTAFWLAAVFAIQPPLAFLSVMGVFSFYLLHTGIVALMKPPARRAVSYTVAVSVCMIVLWVAVVGGCALAFGPWALI